MWLSIVLGALILMVIGGAVLFLKKFDRVQKKHGTLISFVVSSLSAILLVVFGVLLVNSVENHRNRSDAIRLISSGLSDLSQVRINTASKYRIASHIEATESVDSARGIAFPEPTLFYSIVENADVTRYLHQQLIKDIGLFKSNVAELARMQNTTNRYAESGILYLYGEEVWNLEELMRIQLNCIEGNASDERFIEWRNQQFAFYLSWRVEPAKHGGRSAHPWLQLTH